MRERLIEFYRDENAFTIVEYAVAAGLIVATVAGAFQILGVTIDGIISGINAILAG
ncbi:MAG: Flp family type IVb pilin [Woeseiaceae bacterium]|nr:Flp family type IVb pilin [Woeseiaceae bacterium]